MSHENAEQHARAASLVACLDEDAGLLLGFAPPVSDADRGSNRPNQASEVAAIAPSPQTVHVRLGVPGHPGLTLLGVAHDESSAALSSRLGELAACIDKLG